jgi:hypothetical protein
VKVKPLTLELQKYHMQRIWPQFSATTNRGNQAWWTGTLQPTAMIDTYTVEIAYTIPYGQNIQMR